MGSEGQSEARVTTGTLIDCYISTSRYIVDLPLPLPYDVRFILIPLLQMGNGADSCNLAQIASVRNPGSVIRALGPAASLAATRERPGFSEMGLFTVGGPCPGPVRPVFG